MNRKVTAVASNKKLGFVGAQLWWLGSGSTFVVTAEEEAELRKEKTLLTVAAAEDTTEPLTAKTVVPRAISSAVAPPRPAPSRPAADEVAKLRAEVEALKSAGPSEDVALLRAEIAALTTKVNQQQVRRG